MSIAIELGRTLPPATRARVGAWFRARQPEVTIVGGEERLRSFDPNTIAGVVSAVVSVVTLVIQVWPPGQDWNLDKLRSATESALAERGVANIKITHIENYAALESSADRDAKCIVEVVDTSDDRRYKVLVGRKGDTFVVDVDGP